MELIEDSLCNLFGPPIYTVPVPRRLLKTMSGDPFLPLKPSDHSPERLELLEALESSDSTWEDASSVCSSDLDSSVGSTCSSPIHMDHHDDEDGRGSLTQQKFDDVYYSSDEDMNLPFDMYVGDLINSHNVPYRRRPKFSVWQTPKTWSQLSSEEKRESIYTLSRVILEEMDIRQKLEISRIIHTSNNPAKIVIDLNTINNEIWQKIRSYVSRFHALCPKSVNKLHTVKAFSASSSKHSVISKSCKPSVAHMWKLQPNNNTKPFRLKTKPKPIKPARNNNPRSLLKKDLVPKVVCQAVRDQSIMRVSTFRKLTSLQEVGNEVASGHLEKTQQMSLL